MQFQLWLKQSVYHALGCFGVSTNIEVYNQLFMFSLHRLSQWLVDTWSTWESNTWQSLTVCSNSKSSHTHWYNLSLFDASPPPMIASVHVVMVEIVTCNPRFNPLLRFLLRAACISSLSSDIISVLKRTGNYMYYFIVALFCFVAFAVGCFWSRGSFNQHFTVWINVSVLLVVTGWIQDILVQENKNALSGFPHNLLQLVVT